MARTEIHPIKSTLRKALDYICNPEKTDEKILISSYGCEPETADLEFAYTLSGSVGRKGNNLAHHLIQSFDPGEVSYEEAHQIGRELADKVLQGKYEYVLTTHIDKNHVHNHLIFCAANFADHHKYVSNNKTRYHIRNISDRLCREHNLSTIIPGKGQDKGFIEYSKDGERVIRPAKGRGKSRAEYNAEKRGASWKARLQKAIDGYIELSGDFEDMLKRMEADGYTIKRAKYTSYKLPGQGRFTGGPTLGAEYTDERIKERIAGLVKAPKRKPVQLQDDKKISLVIDIENSIKAQQSKGYEHWVKLYNLKQTAKTVTFLQENNLLSYAQLQSKIAEVQTLYGDTAETLKGVEQRLSDMALLIKHMENYRRTLPVYQEYRQAGNKDRFYRQNESALIVHEAAKKALRELGIDGKLPSLAELKKEHDRLTQEKTLLYREYGSLKKQVKEYDTINTNIDQILDRQPTPEQDRQKTKGKHEL